MPTATGQGDDCRFTSIRLIPGTLSAFRRFQPSASAGRISILMLAVSVVLLAWLQYSLPEAFDCRFGLCHRGVRQFADVWPLVPRLALSNILYQLLFVVGVLIAYGSYAVLASALARWRPRIGPTSLGGLALLTVGLALWMPPSLSSDSYSYAAYGRLAAIHGLNPYRHVPVDLCRYGDPTCDFIVHNPNQHPCPYGPLWLSMTFGVAGVVRGLWAQILAFKLVGAFSILGAAFAGKALGERTSAGRGPGVFLLLALNPLLLLEGPGSGHSDVMMIALLLTAAVAWSYGRPVECGLFVGLAASIKLIAFAVLPWMLLQLLRDRTHVRPVLVAVTTGLACLLPAAVLFAPWWSGIATFEGIRRQGIAGSGVSAVAQFGHWTAWISARHWPDPSLFASIAWQWPLLAVFVIASIYLVRNRDGLGWLFAWVLLTLGWAVARRGLWFPWYVSWCWIPSIVLAGRPARFFRLAGALLALGYTLAYAF